MSNIYIFGANGQDGKIAYEIIKNSDKESKFFLFKSNQLIIKEKKQELKIDYKSQFEYINVFSNVVKKNNPEIIFYFAAAHFSFQETSLSQNSNKLDFTNYFLPLHIFNECTLLTKKPKFFYASSSLIFSGSKNSPQSEKTPRSPTCNYSQQKVLTEKFLIKLGNELGIKVYIAILYNHESVYRKENFFTKKVISFCSKLKSNKIEDLEKKLTLFNKNALIDMGYAEDFVRGIIDLVAIGRPGSYIFSTFNPIKVEEFVDVVLQYYNLKKNIIDFKSANSRSLAPLIGNNKKLFTEIGWKPKFYGKELALKLCKDFEKNNSNLNI